VSSIAVAALTSALGVIATWLTRTVAWRLHVVAPPRPAVPLHRGPVPCLGGAAIVLAVAAAETITAREVSIALAGTGSAMVLGGVGYLVLGTFDDIRALTPAAKLTLQTIVAGITVEVARPGLGAIETALAVLWLVAVVNAVNLTDVCDSLAASLAIVSLAAVAAVSPSLALPALIVGSATLGFLVFNRPPATIFLGDGGSHVLGFAIGGLWLLAVAEEPRWNRVGGAILGVGAFAFETAFLIVVRTRRGLPFWRASADHTAMRLQAAGLTRGQTVAISLLIATMLAGLSQWLAHAPGPPVAFVTLAALVSLVIAGRALAARMPVPSPGGPR
jgi:UDP-GlcNAc:undecaprenyl-phosphate GlcNAc-1-phosphate transferase